MKMSRTTCHTMRNIIYLFYVLCRVLALLCYCSTQMPLCWRCYFLNIFSHRRVRGWLQKSPSTFYSFCLRFDSCYTECILLLFSANKSIFYIQCLMRFFLRCWNDWRVFPRTRKSVPTSVFFRTLKHETHANSHKTNAKRLQYFNLICFGVCNKWQSKEKRSFFTTMINIEVMSNSENETKDARTKRSSDRIRFLHIHTQNDMRLKKVMASVEFINKNNIVIMRSIIMETPIKNYNGNYVFHIEWNR